MPKKYMQLLLSINFCLTAIAVAEDSDPGSFVMVPDNTIGVLSDQFGQIWDSLDKINTIHRSKSLQNLISEYKENAKKSPRYDETSEKIGEFDLSNPLKELRHYWGKIFSHYQPKEVTEEDKSQLRQQFSEVINYLDNIIYDVSDSVFSSLSEQDKAFLRDRLRELLVFSQSFITKNAADFTDYVISYGERHPLRGKIKELIDNAKVSASVTALEDADSNERFTILPLEGETKELGEGVPHLHKRDTDISPPLVIADSNERFTILPLEGETEELGEGVPHLHKRDTDISPPLVIVELSKQFDQIWDSLEKITAIYQSERLEALIAKHKQIQTLISVLKETSGEDFEYGKGEAEVSKEDLDNQLNQLNNLLKLCSSYPPKKKVDEAELELQLSQIENSLSSIQDPYDFKIKSLSKREKAFLKHQLMELQIFSQSFIIENSAGSDNTESNGIEDTDSSPESPLIVELRDQFHQIWDSLDAINKIHQSESLQNLISQHKQNRENLLYDESLEEVDLDTLGDQFFQLCREFQVIDARYQEKEIEESDRIQLNAPLSQIKDCLININSLYSSKNSLSKREKAFLKTQLARLQTFSESFMAEHLRHTRSVDFEENNELSNELQLSPLDKIQELLDSCKQEDSAIYAQYEYIINSEEVKIADFLTDSQKTHNQFLYFNKNESLIEIDHEASEGKDPYITTWKIRSADANLIKDWKEEDQITIDKTGIFSKYSLFGERLDYTLTNGKTSIRANFVCKSSDQNTYTILSIDYLENVVILKNGPCLFVQAGDLKEWHVKDSVVLQRDGSIIDPNNAHELINKTRNKKNWVSLKRSN